MHNALKIRQHHDIIFMENRKRQSAGQKEQNVKEAFRAAHTLKGVCQNLGFSNLYAPAVTLTETLRAGQLDGTAEQFAEVEKQYRITMAAIHALD